MRLFSNGPENTRPFELIIIGVIIIGIVAGALWFYYSPDSEETKKSFFMEINLKDDKIKTGENTLLTLKLQNPTERSYTDLNIQLASSYPKIKFFRAENYEITKENGEYRLTVPLYGYIRPGDERLARTFDIGGELYPGVSSMTIEIEIRLKSGENILDEEDLYLTITSEKR